MLLSCDAKIRYTPSSAKLYENVPGAKIVMIDDSGHSPMVEKPQKTLALIRDFIDKPAQ